MDPNGAHLVLLTLLYAYGKHRLCINIHHYAPPCTVMQQAQHRTLCCSRPLWCMLCYTHCTSSILHSIKST